MSGVAGYGLDVDLTGSARHWHAALRADELALPSRISVSDAEGEHAQPPIYESGYRAAWASLYEAIRARTVPNCSADQLVGYLTLAETALSVGSD